MSLGFPARPLFAFIGLAVIAPALAGTILAQDGSSRSGPEDSRVEDASNDVQVQSNGQSQAPPPGYEALDITQAWIGAETLTTIDMGITFGAEPDQQSFMSRRFVAVYFVRGTLAEPGAVQYRLSWPAGGCDPDDAALQYADDDGQGGFRTRACVPLSQPDGKTYQATLEKRQVLDVFQVEMRTGDVLTGFYAEAYTFIAPGTQFFPFLPVQSDGANVRDRAPNDGFGPEFETRLGETGHGHLSFLVERPNRVSNGEATTLVFDVQLQNTLDRADEPIVSVAAVPAGWSARVPSRLALGPGEVVRLPVIVSIPFTHTHGETWTVALRADSTAIKDAYATTELGVFFTDVPQPSEHHGGLLYLHSAAPEDDNPFATAFTSTFQFMETWMNPEPVDADPRATDQPVPAYFNEGLVAAFGGTPGENIARWDFPLSPGLLIGLDFNLDRRGTFLTSIQPSAPANAAVLRAEMLYCDPSQHDRRRGGGNESGGGNGGNGDDDQNGTGGFQGCGGTWIPIATGESDSKPLQRDVVASFGFELVMDPEADILPYLEGSNLGLSVTLATDLPQNANAPEPKPMLMTDASEIQLPIIEYHDPIDHLFHNVGALQLLPGGPQEKSVNPGRSTVFPLNLTNGGHGQQTVRLSLEGPNAAWATFNVGDEITIRQGQTLPIAVVVKPDERASEGERAELFAVAESADDPNVVAVLRLRANVVAVATQDIPDELAPAVVAEEKSPALGAPLLMVLAVAALAVARRRRA